MWQFLSEGQSIDHRTTLLIDDDAYKATLNPPFTAIDPPAYSYATDDDTVLAPVVGDLWRFLYGLLDAVDVPTYVQSKGGAAFNRVAA